MQSETEPIPAPAQQQLQAIRANEEKTLRLLYQTNYPKVERYVLDNSGTVEEAKDVYQEAFIAVWRNVHSGRFQPRGETSLDGYLFQVAKNKWLDFLRSAKRKQTVALNESAGGWENGGTAAEEEELLLHIKTNLKLLGEACQDLLKRFYYGRQPLRTIAAAMAWTEATARNNKYRCLQRLRELVKTNRHHGA